MASVASRISDLLAGAARQLREGGIEEPRREARWLMARVLDISDSRLFAHADDIVDEAGVGRYQDAVRRRAAHEPFAYVVGEQDFWGHSFVVDRRVLVPRPETEILIMEAAAILATWERGHPPGSAGFQPAPDGGGQDGRAPRSNGPLVVDVGTGSGAIACTLALEVPDARVIACDVSPDALAVTSVNRERLGLRERLSLVRGSLLSWLREPVDLVIANLPYIPTTHVPELMPEVSDWEPHLALDGGGDGLDLIRELLADTERTVRPGGTILLEMDPEQIEAARRLVPGATSTIIRDFAGLDRVLRLDLP